MGSVEITKSTVKKHGQRDEVLLEAEKLRVARRISERTGAFRVPRLLEVDERTGILVMERVHHLKGVRNVRANEKDRRLLMNRIGGALALVHRHLDLPQSMRRPLPPPFGSKAVTVCIHGDFSGENVCIAGPGLGEIVLLDWQITPKIGGLCTDGPPEFDVAWFIGNLFRRPVFMVDRLVHARKSAEAFLEGYADQSGTQACLTGLGSYLRALCDYRWRNWEGHLSLPKKALLAPGFYSWMRFSERRDLLEIEHAGL